MISMEYVKISSLYNLNGKADYKGLNVDLFKSNSVMYSEFDSVYLCYEGLITPHKDIKVISKTVYEAERLRFESLPKPLTDSDRIKDLEETMAAMLMGGVV